MRVFEAASEYRRAKGSPAEKTAREQLAFAARELAMQVLRRFQRQIPADVLEELAQDVVMRLIERVETDRCQVGKEDGLVSMSSRNAVWSWLRKSSRQSGHEDDFFDAIPAEEEPLEEQIDRQRSQTVLAEVVAGRLGRLTEQHQVLLRQVIVDEKPIEELVQEELEQRIRSGTANDTPKDLKKARDVVDQRLKRARDTCTASVLELMGLPQKRER